MKFDDLIQYKALHLEYVASGSSAELMLQSLSPEKKKKFFRNVCALISVDLFERLEDTCSLLEITKRQFIESALIECLDKASVRVEECLEMLPDAHPANKKAKREEEYV